jgi:hypothetical protein
MIGTKNSIPLDVNIDAIVYWEDEIILYEDKIVIYS